MSRKNLVYIGSGIGMTVGGFIPLLWGGSTFSMSAIFFSGIGGILGIVVVMKLTS